MVDRTIAPPIHDIRKIRVPNFQKLIIAEDIPLGLIYQKDHPVIILDIVIPSGHMHDPQPGITYLASKMLTEGTSRLTSFQIASKIDFYGGHLEIGPSPDFVSVKLYALKKFFPILLPLLAEIFSDSQFPEKEFDTLKQIRIQQIRQQFARNSVIAGFNFRKCLFGETHPYGLIIEESHIQSINHTDAFDYYKNSFLRKPFFYLAGEVDEGEIKLIEKEFGKLNYRIDKDSNIPSPATSEDLYIDKHESVQTSIRLGNLTVNRKHEDHYKLKVANELLGGFFGSRLMTNIREKKGLTYGIHSSLMHFKHLSFWQIATDVLKEKKEEAISEILNEIKILQEEPPAPDELQTLKNYLKSKIASSFDTIMDVMELSKALDQSGLDLSYWDALFHTIDEVSGEDVSEITRKHFNLENIRKVTVG